MGDVDLIDILSIRAYNVAQGMEWQHKLNGGLMKTAEHLVNYDAGYYSVAKNMSRYAYVQAINALRDFGYEMPNSEKYMPWHSADLALGDEIHDKSGRFKYYIDYSSRFDNITEHYDIEENLPMVMHDSTSNPPYAKQYRPTATVYKLLCATWLGDTNFFVDKYDIINNYILVAATYGRTDTDIQSVKVFGPSEESLYMFSEACRIIAPAVTDRWVLATNAAYILS